MNGGFTKACSGFCAFQVQTFVSQRLVQVSGRSKRKRLFYKDVLVQPDIIRSEVGSDQSAARVSY